jgi:dipeptidyl aminopeptidase/acylaminoacyl peptidase
MTFTPELYSCGVSNVGPSSLLTLLRSIPPYWEPLKKDLFRRVGDPDKDEEFLRSISPLFYVDQIRKPLMVVQGANDPRVKKQESDQIVAAMKEKNIPVYYLVKENEGHGFQNEENQIEFYKYLEAFFARYLGGRSMTPENVIDRLKH